MRFRQWSINGDNTSNSGERGGWADNLWNLLPLHTLPTRSPLPLHRLCPTVFPPRAGTRVRSTRGTRATPTPAATPVAVEATQDDDDDTARPQVRDGTEAGRPRCWWGASLSPLTHQPHHSRRTSPLSTLPTSLPPPLYCLCSTSAGYDPHSARELCCQAAGKCQEGPHRRRRPQHAQGHTSDGEDGPAGSASHCPPLPKISTIPIRPPSRRHPSQMMVSPS